MSRVTFFFFFLSILWVFNSCSSYPPLKTVSSVDLNRYAGKWYEIASFPQRFQRGCHCTMAEYVQDKSDFITVINSCNKDSVNGRLDVANGKAFVQKGTGNAKLKVQFFWPFKGDYWIIDLADDYSYAVVGHPNREYLWILSRTAKMDSAVYKGILDRIKGNGFDISKLQITVQDCS